MNCVLLQLVMGALSNLRQHGYLLEVSTSSPVCIGYLALEAVPMGQYLFIYLEVPPFIMLITMLPLYSSKL